MATQHPSNNLTLLVSNQSFDVNPVDIEIQIDGKVVVQDKFDVQGNGLPQHNWQQYYLRLADGRHSLLVASKKGQAQLQTHFDTKGQHTVMIAYWNNSRSANRKTKGHFTVESSPGPVATM